MWSEKSSLQKFLLIYLSSTILLISIGTIFYYKSQKALIITQNLSIIKQNIEKFIKINMGKEILLTEQEPDFANLNIAIYIDKKKKASSFKIDSVDFNKTFYLKDNRLFLLHKEHKMKKDITIISYIDISKELNALKKKIAIGLIFIFIFISTVAYFLGKILLKPIKKSIHNLEEFVRDSTHELNTPISNILINIELIKELYPKLSEIEEFEKIENSAKRVSKIFRNLCFINLEQNKKHIEQIELKELIKERIEFFKPMIKAKSISLESKLENKTLKIDKEDITRLIDNLLSNAIKYSPKDGVIRVLLSSSSLTIQNSGEIKDTKEIVKKFKREKSSEGGFGLGLYIVKKISDFYGFNLNIESKDRVVTIKVAF